ncbi:class I adenylate-forming enzyme family protein [Pelobacter propionicus]|uniref:AMP-dependent synthetase and ligase n=1 Tax=Pelobacter propionicus (strain DSM 2379 / NBRC 103807 / OttBd1) TaxID=338966 RepID=A1ASZ7_PELPD|nr:class I adenylate-forming enzyme family protein [Pelobacter propionicus]ABL00468.1 AMP-dependent synthetase and ligase [Pelobacter propionicus DSM 2379]
MNSEARSLVHDFLENSAELRPDKTAVVHGEVRATYAQINSMTNELASWLLSQGVSAGDRIVILFKNSIEYIVSYYGVLKARGTAVPLNCDVKQDSLDAILREIRPKAILATGKLERILQETSSQSRKNSLMLISQPALSWRSDACTVVAWEDVVCGRTIDNPRLPISESELASIIYTSGSTGKPKGVMLSHRNITSNTHSIIQYLHLHEDDIQMVVLPFFYVMGTSLLNTHMAVAGTVVINNRFAFPACVIEQMATEHVTGFSGVPSTYAYLLHRSPLALFRDRLTALRYCSQAGGHMSRQTKEKLLQVLPPHTKLYVMYGATEAAARLTYVEPDHLTSKIDSIGRPIGGVTIRIMDEKGNELSPGVPGELVAQGPNIMLGYWMDSKSTSEVLDENGYHTGDMGFMDEEGYLFVTGRKNDLLKVGGHRISLQEIEDALMATELVMEAAVLGVDDPLLGAKLVAIAAPIEGKTDGKNVLARCQTILPKHKIPSEIRLVNALPKSANGKINRSGCRELLNSP